jgi:PST family polysaccharide transporter
MVGMRATFVGQVLKVGFQLVGLVVLSRIIPPEYFGFIAFHITLVAFLEVIREWGNTTVSLQGLRDDYHENLRARKTWFWVSVLIGVLAWIAYSTVSFSVFKELSSEETIGIVILGSTLLAGGLNSQHHVQIVLDKRFKLLVFIEVLAQFLALAVALTLVYSVGPIVSLSLQFAVLFWVSTIGKMCCSGFRPSMPRAEYVRSYFEKGFSLVGLSATNYWNSNLDNLIVSSRFGDTSLGHYSRAFQMYMVPVAQLIWPLEKVVLVHSEERVSMNGLGKFLADTQNKLHILSAYMFTVLGSAGYLIIPWVLGPNWSETADLFQVLCLSGLVQVPLLISHWGFLVSRNNSWLFVVGILRLIIFASALIFLGTRLEFVPFALLLANVAAWLISLVLLRMKEREAAISCLLNNALRILSAALVSIATSLVIASSMEQASELMVFLIVLLQSTLAFPLLVLALGTREQKQLILGAAKRTVSILSWRSYV